MHPSLEFLLLALAGFAANLYGSVVGAGGLVKFPVMIFLGVPLDLAIGTNKLALVFSDSSAALGFYRRGLIRRRILKFFVLSIPLSAWGAFAVADVEKSTINFFVACSFLFLLVLLPFMSRMQTIAEAGSAGRNISQWSKIAFFFVTAALCFYVGFYGVGFGTFMIFAFVLLNKSSFLEACAQARVLSLSTSLVTAGIFMAKGLIDYQVFVPLTAGSVVGSFIGVKAAVTLDSVWIKRGLATVILASSIKLFVGLLG